MSAASIVAALAQLVELEAQRAGKDWHPQGLRSQLRSLLDDNPEIPLDAALASACAAARDPDALTPAAILWPKYRAVSVAADGRPLHRCRTCGELPAVCANHQRVGVMPRHEYQPETPRLSREDHR